VDAIHKGAHGTKGIDDEGIDDKRIKHANGGHHLSKDGTAVGRYW